METSFQFANPLWLWLLLVLPLIAILRGRSGRAVALRLPSISDARGVGGSPKSRMGGLLLSLLLLGLALTIVALARPQLGKGRTEVETSGIDIMLAIDVSGSMQAMDFKIDGQAMNRLEVVKNVVEEFVGERPGDRIGMVGFAGRPYLVSPLTLDHDWLKNRLKEVQIGRVEDGTAIGSAIASSVNHLRDSDAKSRIMVLLTDGVNNGGAANPVTAAEAAKTLGIKIYTIGAGTQGQAPMPMRDMFGRTHMRMVDVEIDEESLREIAKLTGGQYFRATDTDSLVEIYNEINELETTKRTMKKYEDYEELFLFALLPGLGLILLERVLGETRFRHLP
ncbi:vWA domain-containing protein [Haloferula chungangensis]|uniref:VWA domain-containing protein n=1 Tax=Haloferula chungangensis TaxID=1048331 RepID=A0ABW2L255_9BACT